MAVRMPSSGDAAEEGLKLTARNAGSSLGYGSLLAMSVLVAAIAVYLSSPEGPHQAER